MSHELNELEVNEWRDKYINLETVYDQLQEPDLETPLIASKKRMA